MRSATRPVQPVWWEATQTRPALAVEVLVERDEPTPGRVGLELRGVTVNGPATVAVIEEQRDQTGREVVGDLGERRSSKWSPTRSAFALQPGDDRDSFGRRGQRVAWFSPCSQVGDAAIACPLVGPAARTFHGEAGVGHTSAAASPWLYVSRQARSCAQQPSAGSETFCPLTGRNRHGEPGPRPRAVSGRWPRSWTRAVSSCACGGRTGRRSPASAWPPIRPGRRRCAAARARTSRTRPRIRLAIPGVRPD
jgi:hypothetical protein